MDRSISAIRLVHGPACAAVAVPTKATVANATVRDLVMTGEVTAEKPQAGFPFIGLAACGRGVGG